MSYSCKSGIKVAFTSQTQRKSNGFTLETQNGATF